jgi:hypothetical protein
MDPMLVATPDQAQIRDALATWPELATARIRPLLVTAFGDIFVETTDGEVWVASPVYLAFERVARSVSDFERLFVDQDWTDARLLTGLAMRAQREGLQRQPDQVFAIALHPRFTDSPMDGKLVPMTLRIWRHMAAQMRLAPGVGDR